MTFTALEVSGDASVDIARGRDIVIVPQPLLCAPLSFAYQKNAPWQKEVDGIFLNLLKGGFDIKFLRM